MGVDKLIMGIYIGFLILFGLLNLLLAIKKNNKRLKNNEINLERIIKFHFLCFWCCVMQFVGIFISSIFKWFVRW